MFRKSPEQKAQVTIKKAMRTPVPTLSEFEWSKRANPAAFAVGADTLDYARLVGRQNVAYLLRKLQRNGGIVLGYHGTTTANADAITANGFENRVNEEEGFGVSISDSVAALESIKYARDRSNRAGAEDDGRILRVRAVNPTPDFAKGRLEWLADAAHIEVIGVHTPEEIRDLPLSFVPAQRQIVDIVAERYAANQ